MTTLILMILAILSLLLVDGEEKPGEAQVEVKQLEDGKVQHGDQVYDTRVNEETGKLEILYPKDMSPENLAKLQSDIQKGLKLESNATKKNMLLNQKEKDLDAKLALVDEKLAKLDDLERQQAEAANRGVDTTDVKQIHEILGITKEELGQFIVANPDKYNDALGQYTNELVKAGIGKYAKDQMGAAQQQLDAQRLNAQIVHDGADPKDVEAFAKRLGVPISTTLYDVYKQAKGVKTDPNLDRFVDNQQISFVPQSDVKPVPGGALTPKQMRDLSDTELTAYIKMMETASGKTT